MPNSQKDTIEGIAVFGDETVLRARVRALPVGGAANRALEKLFAKWLSVAKSSVAVSSGAKFRVKTVRITGDPALLESKILELLEAGS